MFIISGLDYQWFYIILVNYFLKKKKTHQSLLDIISIKDHEIFLFCFPNGIYPLVEELSLFAITPIGGEQK